MESQNTKKVIDLDESTSTTEEFSGEQSLYSDVELFSREETKEWLDLHGSKLFALEASKFFASEQKKSNKKPTLSRR